MTCIVFRNVKALFASLPAKSTHRGELAARLGDGMSGAEAGSALGRSKFFLFRDRSMTMQFRALAGFQRFYLGLPPKYVKDSASKRERQSRGTVRVTGNAKQPLSGLQTKYASTSRVPTRKNSKVLFFVCAFIFYV
jgi:hypothetical protein